MNSSDLSLHRGVSVVGNKNIQVNVCKQLLFELLLHFKQDFFGEAAAPFQTQSQQLFVHEISFVQGSLSVCPFWTKVSIMPQNYSL